MKLKILGKRHVKKIFALIKKQWGADVYFKHVFLQDRNGKLYIINRDISRVDVNKLQINSIGMYFGAIANEELRLSIEASQMIGPSAEKNTINLKKEQISIWLAGNDLDYLGEERGFVLIRYKNDFLGAGRIKEGKILNFIPKPRRLKSTEII